MTYLKMADGETLNKYCERNKINYSSIYNYIEKGFTAEEGVKEYKISIKNRRKYFFGGMRLLDFCQKHDINYKVILDRVRNGKSMEDAVKEAMKKRKENKPNSTFYYRRRECQN